MTQLREQIAAQRLASDKEQQERRDRVGRLECTVVEIEACCGSVLSSEMIS